MSNIKEQVVNELHKPARKTYRRRHVIVKGLHDLIQADLAIMSSYAKVNNGYNYILVVINAFSKFVWAVPVKRKTGKDIMTAMKKILNQMVSPPKNLQTDNGTEFYNKDFQQLMKQYNINHYSTFSNLKASIAERAIRSLKNLLWKQFSLQGSYKWLKILPEIVQKYNNSKHSTTGAIPSTVNDKNAKYIIAFNNLKTVDPRNLKFHKGDSVRISKYRHIFAKGYTPNWTNEIFKVKQVKLTNPTTYILEDDQKEEIQGAFYTEELQKVKYPDVYLIEKVIRRKENKLLVKYLGLKSKFNSWINKSDLV